MNKRVCFFFLFLFLISISCFAQNVVWKKNLGSHSNIFHSQTTVSDGIIAVGTAYGFGYGDWLEVEGKGISDAIIVKYDKFGNVIWKKNFGGKDIDSFMSVVAVPEGVVATGYSYFNSFGSNDWEEYEGKGGECDAIIVKYDHDGNVVWKRNFGGHGMDNHSSACKVSDGIVAVGFSNIANIGTGDWAGFTGKGWSDAIIVKYDYDGNVVWKNNFGGHEINNFNSVLEVSDGIIAVGTSTEKSFDSGDWDGIIGKGTIDAIIVKYDRDGNVLWKKNFGGMDTDAFASVTTISNDIVAVGHSLINSFGNGDWTDIPPKGNYFDAIIVKYTNSGVTIIEPTQKLSKIDVYPNPTAGELIIESEELKIKNIEILDITGKIALANHIITTSSQQILDISNLNSGIYIVKIITMQGEIVKKVIKL